MASQTVDKHQFGIMHVIRNSFLSQNYHYSNYWDVVAVEAVHNSDLEEQFQEKRRDFIHIGRTKDELIERLLMGCYIKDEDIKFISLNGLQCGKHGTNSYLGNGRKGVTLGRHADILLKSFYNDGYEQCWIVVFKVIFGRQKEVLHIQTPPYREPNQDADCHVSILAPVPAEDCLQIQDIKAQVFMFDKDENGDFLRRPRQCVPIACVKFKRASPIEEETKSANQTSSDVSIGGDAKDSFTILKDSLAKMKESFVLLSKETVFNSKTNHAHPSTLKVPVNGSSHRNAQQPQTEMTKRTIGSETHKKALLDKRKLTVTTNSESVVKKVDLDSDSATDIEPYDLEPTSAKKCVKKVSRRQREDSKERKLKPVSVSVASSEERSTARSTTSKVTSGETEKAAKSSLTKKRGQLPNAAPRSSVDAKDLLKRPSSIEELSRTHRLESKCPPSRTNVSTGGATVGKKIISGTDKKRQNAGSHLMPVVSNRKTRLIEALPVPLLTSSPSLTSAFARRPSVVDTSASEVPLQSPATVASSNEIPRQSPTVVTPSNEVPRQRKSILRNPITTARNVLPVSTPSSSSSGSQSFSNIYSRLTTSSVKQKRPSFNSEAPQNNVNHSVAAKQTHNTCQIPTNSAYKHKDKIALNIQNNHSIVGSPLEAKPLFHIPTNSLLEEKPHFHIPTRSPLEEKPLFHIPSQLEEKPLFHIPISSHLETKTVSIINSNCLTSAVEFDTKTALKSCLATSLRHSNSIASITKPKNSSSLYKEPNSNCLSQITMQTCGTPETHPTQVPVTNTAPVNHNAIRLLLQDQPSQRAEANSITLVPPATTTPNDPISCVQNPIKSASVLRSCLTPKTRIETVYPVQLSVATAEKHPFNRPRTNAQSSTAQSTKMELMSEFQSQKALQSLNGKITSPCLSLDTNPAICLPHNIDRNSALMESGVKLILKSAPDDVCLRKDSDRSECKAVVADIHPDAAPIVIPQKKLLLLQHGFISSITKQLAADLNDVANLLRSSKPEKVNRREKLALLSLREINSKFTELTPICVQYKQLFRHLKDGHPVRLPELDELYSQEYIMNECCNVLGKVFSELKTSQLKSETVLQKTSLAVAWLVDSKNELISCINSIKGIVENVLLTCDLRSVPSTKSSTSTPEANGAGNQPALEIGMDLESAAIHNVAIVELRSSNRGQDFGQVTKTTTAERSLQDRIPIIPLTTQARSQRLPEINEIVATVSKGDHLASVDRSHSDYEAGLRSTSQNGEVTPPSGNYLNDAAKEPDLDRAPADSQNEASNGGDIITEGYSEQNLSAMEPNTLVCPSSVSAVDNSGQAEEESQAERDTDCLSAVCTVQRDSSQPSSESTSDDGALISSMDGILSAEDPLILAADGADAPSDLSKPIKTERSDPPNLIARPPQTIILGADDVIPPYIPTPGGNASNIVQSVSKGGRIVNHADSLSTDLCSKIEISTVVRLEEGALKQDGSRYESCVSLESSRFNLDSMDEIPPLLTPDSAFDYSSIVYNVKSDEPPILEANTNETSRNIENVESALGVSARESTPLAVTPRDSDTLVVASRDSPALVATPNESSTLSVTEKDSATLVLSPRDSSRLVSTPRDSPPLVVAPEESPTLPMTSRASPPLAVTPVKYPTLPVTPRDSPPLVVSPEESHTLPVTSRDSPSLAVAPGDLSTFDSSQRSSSSDASGLMLLISGTRAATIIMNSDAMVACVSSSSQIEMGANNVANVDADTRVGAHVNSHVDPDAPSTDVKMKTSLQDDAQFAAVKGTFEELDKREGSYYVRVVGELTGVGAMAAENDIDAQSYMNGQNQSLGDPTTKYMPDSPQPIHDNSKEDTRMSTPYSLMVKSDQRDMPDDIPKKELGVYLQPSSPRSIISQESLSTDLSTLSLNSDERELKSEQTLAEMTSSLYRSTSCYGETAYVALLSGSVRICGSEQSQYVFKIEPDDDFDQDPVCLYDSPPKAPEQPSASAQHVSFDVSTGADDQVGPREHEIDSSKAGDSPSLQEQNIEKVSQVSSDSPTETLETVVCKSPCFTLSSDLESQSISSPRHHATDSINNEHEMQNYQKQTSDLSGSEPETHISQTVVLPLIQSPLESGHSDVPDVSSLILSTSGSVSSGVPVVSSCVLSPSESVSSVVHRVSSLTQCPSESVPIGIPVVCSVTLPPSESFPVVFSSIQSPDHVASEMVPRFSSDLSEVISLREMQQLSVSQQQMPLSCLPEKRGFSRSQLTTMSDDRCASPPTVYTEPPQSPPPEAMPLTAVIKQEIPDDLDSLVAMERSLNHRACHKRKRERRQHQEASPIVVHSDEGDESVGCSVPPQKQRCADWSIQSCSKGAESELKESVVRFVEFCSSDAFGAASGNPLRAKARGELADRHQFEADADSDDDAAAADATAVADDKLMDGPDLIRPKMASVGFLSMYNERKIEDDGKANDEEGSKNEEKRRSLRYSRSRNFSYDRDSASSGSRIRDTVHAERNAEGRASRDPVRWRTPFRVSDDQRERPSTRLSSGSHESLRDRRRRDEGDKASPSKVRGINDRPNSRWQNVDGGMPGEQSRRSEGRGNCRSYMYCPAAEYNDQRSRSTRPMTAVSRSLQTREYDIRRDHSDDGDNNYHTFIDPSKLKKEFWSKGHPRFKCSEGCDQACVAASTAQHESDRRRRLVGGNSGGEANQRVGKSSLVQDVDILEETLKLNLEMLEASQMDDGEKESRRDDATVPVRRGAKRPHLQSPDTGGSARRRRRRRSDGEGKDREAEAKEEAADDYQSTTSSKRSRTLSRLDKSSDCEDRFGNAPTTLYDDDRYTSKKTTPVSTDGTEHWRALQPSSCGRSSVASGGSGSEGRISREIGDEEMQPSLNGISTIRMSKSTVQTGRQVAARNPSNIAAGAAAVPIQQSRASVTYVTEILQTSNFSTQVYIEKHKTVVI